MGLGSCDLLSYDTPGHSGAGSCVLPRFHKAYLGMLNPQWDTLDIKSEASYALLWNVFQQQAC